MHTSLPQFEELPQHAPQYSLKEMFDLGIHYGHQKQKWHPKMAPFIHMEKDGVHIIDLAKTAAQLSLAYNYLYQLGHEGKPVVFVGTKRQAREIVRASAESVGAMFITTRWLGGLLTNWDQVKKSIKKMTDTEKKLAEDGFKGRTKYEITQIEKEVARAKRFFEGIQDLTAMPSVLVVVDPTKEKIAVAEARAMGVPIIALIDTNSNPDKVDLPIPGNDDAVKSVAFIVEQLAQGYGAGKATKGKPVAPETPAAVAPVQVVAKAEETPESAPEQEETKTAVAQSKKAVKKVAEKAAAPKAKSAAATKKTSPSKKASATKKAPTTSKEK